MAEPLGRLDFSRRADLEEQMDGPCSYEELRVCLRDLAVVNRLTLAHRPTMLWLESLFSSTSQSRDAGRLIKLVDVGCGYGDLLRKIESWAGERGVRMELIGVDVNANAVRSAREATPAASRIRWVVGDVCACAEAQDADIATVSTVTHHLNEEEIVRMLQWMERVTRLGWMVNDLHRMPVPYRIFSAAARGPWWHRFIRLDGLVSIRRSFVEEDWQRMCSAAWPGFSEVEIRAHRPARLVVSRRK
jgi:SAM-dependent methyltransferase